MKKLPKTPQLVDQRNALTLYLDALLNEVSVEEEDSVVDTDTDRVTDEVTDNVTDDVIGQVTSNQAIADEIRQSESQTQVTSSEAPVVVIATSVDVENQEPNTHNETSNPHEPPDWAMPRCQVLTFALRTMQMAAPLNKLNGIIPFPENLTALPGQSPWFIGLARNRDQNVKVIDLAGIIQPHHRLSGQDGSKPGAGQYILLIGEGQWGILCNHISTVLALEPHQVQWQRSPHVEYILGTVIDKMHSVLCVDTLITRLNSGQLV